MTRVPRWLFVALVFSIIFLLRIPYWQFVWADEGLWFTAAQELLRGKVLYREIWFDKPPGVAWTYAGLFALFGPSLLAVRLFTICYATGVALALWHIGGRIWGEAEARLAALLWALYNATWIHSQVQPLAVDQLVLLPYLYSGYFFLRDRPLASGLLAAVSFALNPKSLALLLFFGMHDVLWRRAGATRRWARLAATFAMASVPWAAYLAMGDKWRWYARDVWAWGFTYVTVYSPAEAVLNGLQRTLNYAGFHLALVLGLVMLVVNRVCPPAQAILLWMAAGYVGVAAGGRFFPRYFYQVLPLLCLVGARGYLTVGKWRPPLHAIFWAGVLFAVVRFHARGAVITYESITGRETAYMARWDDLAIDRDSRAIAARVSGTLFVWGYRPEIYFYCQCPAASSFLSSQPLTGVPADIHLRESRVVWPALAAENRRRLLDDLRSTMPRFIVDGLGPYNPPLAMTAFPELLEFLEQHYRREEEVGQGIIYKAQPSRERKRAVPMRRSPGAAPSRSRLG